MADEKSFTYSDVAEHASKKDLWCVIHDVVYDISSFVDEHPGGEEVLLDIAGQDSTEAFEDVGHSDEAREILEPLKVGTLERKPGDPKPKVANPAASSGTPTSSSGSSGTSPNTIMLLLLSGLVAVAAYFYLQQEQQAKA